MPDWNARIDLEHPCWDGYRVLIRRLGGGSFPSPGALSCLLPPGLKTASGKTLRFVPAGDLPGVAYERHIFETGEVSTRAGSWHDLFNALAWCRFPALKAAMNAAHYGCLDRARDGRRGRRRDALTLLDESGVIVAGADRGLLDDLRARDWPGAFQRRREDWPGASVMVCGHAILEKMLAPYKALTAHALFVHLEGAKCALDLDRELGDAVAGGGLLCSTRDLSPLPLMGIPGWWTGGNQDAAFYADRGVFRPPPGTP